MCTVVVSVCHTPCSPSGDYAGDSYSDYNRTDNAQELLLMTERTQRMVTNSALVVCPAIIRYKDTL